VSLSSTDHQLARIGSHAFSLSLGGVFRPTDHREFSPTVDCRLLITPGPLLHRKNAATFPPSTVVTSPVVFSAKA
jgi:hypothetical protein